MIRTTTSEQVVVAPAGGRGDSRARVRVPAWLVRSAVPGLIAVLVATTLVGWQLLGPLAVSGPDGAVPATPWVPWWLLAALFTASQSLVLNVQIRREARSVFLSEIPMVVGLLHTTAHLLILARVLGAAISFGILLKQYRQPRKLTFNVALAGAEAVVALSILHLAAPRLGAAPPGAWFAALAATAVSTGFAAVAVGLVIAFLDARVHVGELVVLGLRCTGEALPAGILGVVAAAAWAGSEWAAIPVLTASAALLWAYRAYARLRERHLTLERLYQFSRGISLAPGGDEVVSTVLDQAMELLHAECAWLMFLPVGTDRTATTFTLRPPAGMSSRVVALTPEEEWLLDALIEEGRPILLGRSSKAARERRFLDARTLRDGILVPVPGESGAVAVLAVGDRQGDIRGFDASDVRLLELVANQVATALHNGRLVDQLRHESLHDSLTGLPNRAMLQRELTARLAGPNPRPLTVAILDLDSFKDVNDTLGHQQGDLLLQQVAERLTLIIGDPSTLVARLGGDEFAVVRPGGTRQGAEFLGSLLLRSFRHPFPIDGLELTVGTSIGISIAPHHGTTAPTLLKRADLSMYEAKQHGSGVRVFDPSADRTSRSRLALVTHLRQAIDADQIEIHLQPEVVLEDGSLHGAEALARWTHPEHGRVPPAEFIALAERAGLIRPLTERVLGAAVAACARWQVALPGVGISVNVSPRCLADDGIVSVVEGLLGDHGLPARLLTLEITESSIMTNPKGTLRLLEQLRDLDVRLSIDDFGTGYTSLSYLRRLPVTEVKIDRSFVMGSADQTRDPTIVRSIVDLAHNLGLVVVAEGVAEPRMWRDLVAVGCELGQGHAICAPLPLDQGRGWMLSYRPVRSAAAG